LLNVVDTSSVNVAFGEAILVTPTVD